MVLCREQSFWRMVSLFILFLFNLYLFSDKKIKFKKLITTMIYKTIFTYLTEKLKTKNVKPFSENGSNLRSWSYDSLTYLLIKTHKLHLQIGPNHWFIYSLNFLKLVSAFICSGTEYQIWGPNVFKLFLFFGYFIYFILFLPNTDISKDQVPGLHTSNLAGNLKKV